MKLRDVGQGIPVSMTQSSSIFVHEPVESDAHPARSHTEDEEVKFLMSGRSRIPLRGQDAYVNSKDMLHAVSEV